MLAWAPVAHFFAAGTRKKTAAQMFSLVQAQKALPTGQSRLVLLHYIEGKLNALLVNVWHFCFTVLDNLPPKVSICAIWLPSSGFLSLNSPYSGRKPTHQSVH